VKDKRGWRIKPAYGLPGGFELWEQDDHCVDLYHGKEHVAVFSAGVTEREILEACRDYMGGGGEQSDACVLHV
jgi:hypothetical protein